MGALVYPRAVIGGGAGVQLLRDLMRQGKGRHGLRRRQTQLGEPVSGITGRYLLHSGQPTNLLWGDLDGDRAERSAAVLKLRAEAVWAITVRRRHSNLPFVHEHPGETRPSCTQRGGELITKLIDGGGVRVTATSAAQRPHRHAHPPAPAHNTASMNKSRGVVGASGNR